MNDMAIAIALHVFSIVLWIGGVGFATAAVLPTVRRIPDEAQRIALFEAVEGRFKWIARFGILLAGATGFYMVVRLDAWSWFGQASTWWMSAMVFVWTLFFLLLFVLEPFVLHRHFKEQASRNSDASFRRAERLHWVLLILSLITILGAAAGANGLRMFG